MDDKRSFNSDEMVIRRITCDDTALLVSFFRSLSDHTKYFFRPHPFDEAQAAIITGTELASPDIRRYIAVVKGNESGEVIAGYAFFWNWPSEAPTIGIGVADEYQGIGLGRKLMDFLAAEAVRYGKKALLLTTLKNNYSAQALYKKCGYIITGEGEGEVQEGRLSYYEMKLELL